MEDVLAAGEEAQQLLLLRLLDRQVPPDRQIDDRRRDVAHVRGAVDQHSHLSGREVFRRFVLGRDRPGLRIAATGAPQAPHRQEGEHREQQWPVRPREIPQLRARARTLDHAGIPGDGNGEALTETERAGGGHPHPVPQDLDPSGFLGGAMRSGEHPRSQARDPGRQYDLGGRPFDGNRPLVAGDVPVQLVPRLELVVVSLGEAKPVLDGVADPYGTRRVLRAGDPNLDLLVVPFAALLEPQPGAGAVGHLLDLHAQRIREARRRLVANRDRAEDAVVRAGEARLDGFRHVDAAAAVHTYLDVEAGDDPGALGGTGGRRPRPGCDTDRDRQDDGGKREGRSGGP